MRNIAISSATLCWSSESLCWCGGLWSCAVLGQDQAGSESAAEKIELLVFEARQQLADDKYLMHLRGLCATIKASNELKAKALAGELQPVQEALQAQLEASRK